MKPSARPGPLSLAIGVLATTMLVAAPQEPARQVFRSGVDLVAVDVQVIDRDGRPVGHLAPESFEVSFGGRRRRVVSADFIEHVSAADQPARIPVGPVPNGTNATSAPDGLPARLFVLAIDSNSFTIDASRAAMIAARGFVQRLLGSDLVGLFVYPAGIKLDPSLDRASVGRALDTVTGHRQLPRSEYNLTASEIVDITAEMTASPSAATTDTVRKVQLRECATDARCPGNIRSEANSMAMYLEGQVTQSLNSLRSLIRALGAYPGRKTVMLVSGGMAVSDRSGGRPDVSGLAKQLGAEAAEVNTTLYVLHLDASFRESYSAESGRADSGTGARDSRILGRWLDEFSSAAGGALMRLTTGGGETFFDRVLRETSGYYLLAVEPTDSDRDGRVRDLKVKVTAPGTTVRSRTLVVVPKRRS